MIRLGRTCAILLIIALRMTYLARKTLEEEPDHQSASARLSEMAIIAPVYYILSGT